MKKISPVFSFFFIKPIFSSLLLIFLIAAGVLAYFSMIKESNPDLEIPQALIYTSWPSASPELVEKEISIKIEKKIKSLKGLKRYLSGSLNSLSIIAVEFDVNSSMQESIQLLRSKVSEAESDLPKDAKKPTIELVSITDIPIITFMLYGDLDDSIISVAAEDIQSQLEKIPGIKKVDLSANRKEVVQVLLKPERINSLNISSTLIKNKIQEANIDVPWDKLENEDFTATIKMSGRFTDTDQLLKLPLVKINESRIVELGELAYVKRDLEKEKSRVFLSKKGSKFKKCVAVTLYKLPGKDTISLIDTAKEKMEKLKKSPDWPFGMEYTITSDESVLIWDNLSNVFNNCWQGMLGVFLVLFVMVTWREALIAGLSIPITLLGTVAVLWVLGYTMNEIVIIGMILAFGIMVDDFILMMEGMHHALTELKLSIAEAQIHTLKTYAIPSLSGSLTTIIVFLPLMAIGGIDGKFIRLIPLTAAICLVLSYFVSVFINVPLSGLILKFQKVTSTKTKVDRLNDLACEKLTHWLKINALCTKGRAGLLLATAIAIFVLSVFLVGLLPSTLYPKADGRNLGITVEMSPDTSLDKAHLLANELGEILRSKDYLENVIKYVGKKSPFSIKSLADNLSDAEAPYLVGISCVFEPLDKRAKMAFEYLPELRKELEVIVDKYPGSFLVISPDVGGATSEDPVQIDISGNNMEELRLIGTQVKNKLREVKGVSDVRDNLGTASLDVNLIPKREALQFYGISQSDMAEQIRLAMSDDKIGTFKLPGNKDDLDIRMGYAWPSRNGQMGGPKDWEEVSLLGVFNNRNERIPIFSILDPIVTEAPLSITRKNGDRSVKIMAKTDNRTVTEILEDFEPVLKEMKKKWPAGYTYFFSGEAEATDETYTSMNQAFLIALFLVFAILTILFNNYKQPFIVMFSVLFGLIGTFFGFFLFWIPLSFPAMIGIISLLGIVVNDAIVMIDTMNGYLKEGYSVIDAAASGSADRLRPIISTTLTTIVGLVPLSLSSPLWMPLCLAIIFGLIVATFVSIVIIPCLFLLLTTPSKEVTE